MSVMSAVLAANASLKLFFALLALTLLTVSAPVRAQTTSSPVSLGDRVWFDNDRNGRQDPYDSNLSGVAVNLFDAEEQLVARALTDEAGRYLFTTAEGVDTESVRYGVAMVPGETYSLRISLNETELFGYFPAFAYLGSDPALDSNGTLVGAEVVETVTLSSVESEDLSLDFGFRTGNFGESVIDLPDDATCPIPGLEEFLVEDAECGGFGGAAPEEPVRPGEPEEVEEEIEERMELPRGGAAPEEGLEEGKVSTKTPALIRTGGVD